MPIQCMTQWMSESALHHYIVAHSYVWPTLESLHFIGLCLLFGSLLLIDLRALGVSAATPFEVVEKFLFVAITGFVINLSTGIAFLFGDPERYFDNPSFQLKMVCIVLALLNAVYFSLSMKKRHKRITVDMKWAAALSLVLWVAVIVFGRLIPYVE